MVMDKIILKIIS